MNELFAAEPSSCDSAMELKVMLSSFGPFTGRYLAKYPSLWESGVYKQFDAWPEVEAKRARATLSRAKQELALVPSDGRGFDAKLSWIENLEKVQRSGAPFDGVIVSRAASKTGEYPSIEEFEVPPTAGVRIPATAGAYARASGILLYKSYELHFIDPYFDAIQSARRDVLQEMLTVAAKGRAKGAWIWARADRIGPDARKMCSEILRISEKSGFSLGRSLTLRVVNSQIDHTRLHDRYLLSLYGAIRFEHGFQALSGGRTASVEPVSRDIHAELVTNFLECESSASWFIDYTIHV
jgi:hypothetical protein